MLRAFSIALLLSLAASAASAFEVDETLRSDREAVRQVQSELTELGYSPGGIDGAFGPGTQRAITAFQAENAADLTLGLTPEMVARIAQAYNAWFAPPETVSEGLLGEPEDLLTVDITDLDPDCNIPTCNINMFLLAADDLTGDRAPDLVVGTVQFDAAGRDTGVPSPVVILVNDGNGRFSVLNRRTPQAVPRRVHPREAVVADFNSDNVNDLFVAAQGLDRDPFPGEANLLMLSPRERSAVRS